MKQFNFQIRTFLYFVYLDTKTGLSSYILVYEPKMWYDAQSYCQQYYKDLASARDATENSAIGGLSPQNWYWIGLIRNPWEWSDKATDMSFITWSPGNPNDYLMNKSCGYLSNNQAAAAQCSNIMPFYCSGELKLNLVS